MADLVLTDANVSLGGVDLSTHVREVTLSTEHEALESSTMGSTGRTFNWGPDSWSLSVTFMQDLAANAVEDTLETIGVARASVEAIVHATSSPVSETNAYWTGQVIMTERPLIDGSWGENVEITVNFQGTGALVRTTA